MFRASEVDAAPSAESNTGACVRFCFTCIMARPGSAMHCHPRHPSSASLPVPGMPWHSQALSVSLVILGALYLRRKYTIDPNTVYRLAMVRLNTHPGLLEVMGAPLVGSPVRATVLTGGKLRFKGLVPRIQSRRAQIIFPLRGSERKGLASLEAKKRKVGCASF